jgi:hypothetical protein
MTADRPMSEYENALSEIARVLAMTVLDMGADREILRVHLEQSQQDFENMGSKNGAAAIGLLIRTVFETKTYRVGRPPLHIVKPDEDSN